MRKTVELQQVAAKAQFDTVAFRERLEELEGERDALRCVVREERGRFLEVGGCFGGGTGEGGSGTGGN